MISAGNCSQNKHLTIFPSFSIEPYFITYCNSGDKEAPQYNKKKKTDVSNVLSDSLQKDKRDTDKLKQGALTESKIRECELMSQG